MNILLVKGGPFMIFKQHGYGRIGTLENIVFKNKSPGVAGMSHCQRLVDPQQPRKSHQDGSMKDLSRLHPAWSVSESSSSLISNKVGR